MWEHAVRISPDLDTGERHLLPSGKCQREPENLELITHQITRMCMVKSPFLHRLFKWIPCPNRKYNLKYIKEKLCKRKHSKTSLNTLNSQSVNAQWSHNAHMLRDLVPDRQKDVKQKDSRITQRGRRWREHWKRSFWVSSRKFQMAVYKLSLKRKR